MRHFINLSLLIFVSAFLQTCQEESDPSKGSVQFTFAPGKIEDSGGRIKGEDFPAGSYLLVSIQKNGRAVLTRKEINLVKVGDEFISDPIALPPGDYQLTDFWVVGPGRVMLYASPKAGSPLASLVDRPLPFSFVVTDQALIEEAVQVIDVTESDPEDFGYASFELDVIRRFGVSVFIPQNGDLALTTGEVFILRDDDTLHVHSLAAKVNTILFEEEPDDSLELVVIKDGYSRYARKFTFNQLKAELQGNPVIAVLAPALTFIAHVNDYGVVPPLFEFNLDAHEGSVSIDWGDGSSQIMTLPVDGYITHEYEQGGPYFISVTGDLEKIFEVRIYYDAWFSRIDLRHLTELLAFSAGDMNGITPSVIDFTHNTKLELIALDYLPKLEQVIIPDGLKLRAISIEGPNLFTTADVDYVIDKTYESVTHFNTQDGYFSFVNYLTGEMGVPPSPASLAKVATLRDVYLWTVRPDF